MEKTLKVLIVLLCLCSLNAPGFAQRRSLDSAIRRKGLPMVPKLPNFGKPLATVGFLQGYMKGILDCDITFSNCMVMNMPVINQSDSRVSSDVLDMRDFGCYDASIVTLISTALANRKTAQDFGGRTKIFDQITGSSSQPKEIAQLSYQYKLAKDLSAGKTANGKLVQPLYFHEVVADFNKGKILQKCDPYVYGNCDEVQAPTAMATNLYGDAFRHWISTDTITNEDIIKLMEQGYAVMIAFVRYKPTGKFDTPQSFTVDFKLDSFHKVVFSGFRKGAEYPLIINDVGSGERFNVRLSNDLTKRKFGAGGLDKSKIKINYPSDNLGANTKNFIEYEFTGKNVGDMVFFLDHYDALRIK
jgi:hypothetical protein